MKKIQKSLVRVMYVALIALITSGVSLQAATSWKSGNGYSGVIGWSISAGRDNIYARTAVAYDSPNGPCLRFDYRTKTYYSGDPVAWGCIMGSSTYQRSISIAGVKGSYSQHSQSHPSEPWSKDNITSPW